LYLFWGGSEGIAAKGALVGDCVHEYRYNLNEFDDDEGHKQEEDGEELYQEVAVQDDQYHPCYNVPHKVLRDVHQLQDLPGLT
jgi:hypothetical protein